MATHVGRPGRTSPLFDVDGCHPALYGAGAGQLARFANCFRIALDEAADTLGAHSITLEPSGADVAWGEIA